MLYLPALLIPKLSSYKAFGEKWMIPESIINTSNATRLLEYATRHQMSADMFLSSLLDQYSYQQQQDFFSQSQRRDESYHRLMEALYDKAIFAILIIDNEAQIVHANDKATEILGYDYEELVTLTIWNILPETSLGEGHKLWEYFLTQGELKGDFQLKRCDKSVIDIEFQATGNILPALHMAIFQDVTERRQAEHLQRELLKEKELHELKTQFLSMVSHEFRTPMTVIVSSTALLKDYFDQLTPEQRTVRLDKIQVQIGHLASLLDEMTFLNKIQTKGYPLEPVWIEDWEKVLQDMVEDIGVALPNHVPVVTKVEGNAKGFVSDTFLLQQILINLITNAVKYSKPDKTVWVECQCQPTQVAITIRDEGIGIPPEDQKQLFEPFYRASNVGAISGTGLGLVIVKKAVEAHHGTIELTSHLDVGTTLRVILHSLEKHPSITYS
jgi:PAS domain S-box-containing protein